MELRRHEGLIHFHQSKGMDKFIVRMLGVALIVVASSLVARSVRILLAWEAETLSMRAWWFFTRPHG